MMIDKTDAEKLKYKYKHECSVCHNQYDSDFAEKTKKQKVCYVCLIKMKGDKPQKDYHTAEKLEMSR